MRDSRIRQDGLTARKEKGTGKASLPGLLNQLCDQSGPAGLVACTDPSPVVAVEVFVEQEAIMPMWIVLESVCPAEDRTFSFGIREEDMYQPTGDLCRHFPEGGLTA